MGEMYGAYIVNDLPRSEIRKTPFRNVIPRLTRGTTVYGTSPEAMYESVCGVPHTYEPETAAFYIRQHLELLGYEIVLISPSAFFDLMQEIAPERVMRE